MTQEHPITPPPELRQLWAQQAQRMNPRDPVVWQQHIATEAARWGADQELEACCEWMASETPEPYINALRADRRPKPPSLKEQALALISHDPANQPFLSEEGIATIRRALESLPD